MRRAVVLATLFVTSARADCGADNMVVEAVMIVDVMAVMARRREDDECWSIICDPEAGSSNGCSALPIVSSPSFSGAAKRTRSDG